MKTSDLHTAQNAVKLQIATRLIREVCVTHPVTEETIAAITTRLALLQIEVDNKLQGGKQCLKKQA